MRFGYRRRFQEHLRGETDGRDTKVLARFQGMESPLIVLLYASGDAVYGTTAGIFLTIT